MSLRRILSRQPNPYPILRPTLSPPLCNRRNYNYPPHIPPRIRLKQSTRHLIQLRQNSIPPILLPQRYPRLNTYIYPIPNTSPILTQSPRRPRKLYPSKSPSNPPTH
uniref:Uncharacterized protein n=1 Tax=Pavo cristatus TaxID=9049 RepID=A0A8C9F424_PAVCR